MPTQKAAKRTRKIERKRGKTNLRRLNVGKGKLSLKHFTNISHKRNRNQYEESKRNREQTENANKKRKLNNEKLRNNANKPPQIKKHKFGFGPEMQETNAEYQRFLTDLKSDDDDDDEVNDNDATDFFANAIDLNPMTAAQIESKNKKLMTEIDGHKSALQSLQEADPEFYEHLKQMEDGLLSFGDNNQIDLGNLGEIDDVIRNIETSQIKRNVNEVKHIDDDEKINGDDDVNDDSANRVTSQNKEETVIGDIDSFMDESDDNTDRVTNNDDVFFHDGGSDEDDEEDVTDEDVDDDDEDDAEADMSDDFDDFDDPILTFSVGDLRQIVENLENDNSIEALKQLLRNFNEFVQFTMIDQLNGNNDKKKNKKKSTKAKITLLNNEAFQQLLKYCLTDLPLQMNKILKITDKQKSNPSNLVKTNKEYLPYRSLLRSYLKNLYLFFANVNDSSMLRLFYIHCKEMTTIILVCASQSMKRLYIRKSCNDWSSGTPNLRIDAFLFLYGYGTLCNTNGDGELFKLLKYMYQSFVIVCKRVSYSTMPGIHFMINSMAQMYLLNPVVSYQDAFNRLRSIAFHCKQAITTMAKHETKNESTKQFHSQKMKKEKIQTIRSVYNWRFINILKLWAKVLGAHADRKNSDLHLLYYPFVQIACSVLTLTRSAAYDPARLKIISALLDLIRVCQSSSIPNRRIFVPLSPHLITILNNPAFCKTHKKQTKKAKKKVDLENDSKNEENDENEPEPEIKKNEFNMNYKLKTSDNDFGKEYLHASLVSHCTKLMFEYFTFHSYSIAFPEIAFPTQVFLRKFLANPHMNNANKVSVKLLNSKLSDNVNWIQSKRKSVKFSPKDFEKVYAFLSEERNDKVSPMDKFVKTDAFEQIVIRKTALDAVNGDRTKQMMGGDDAKTTAKKKNRKKKKMKNKKKKYEKQEILKENIKSKRVLNELKHAHLSKLKNIKKYATNNTNAINNKKNVVLTSMGDIVEDFELSD